MELLKELCKIHSPSGEEYRVKEFIINYLQNNINNFVCKPEIISEGIKDCLVLVFGKPKAAVFIHTDTVGFTVQYNNKLIPIGSPDYNSGDLITAIVNNETIESNIVINEEDKSIFCNYPKVLEPGTSFIYKSNLINKNNYINGQFLDNRVGVWIGLKLAETITDGIIVFTTGEEHGGGSVGFLASLLYNKYNINQSLICDVTWVSQNVLHEKGAVLSLRDANIPRKIFLNKIVKLLKENDLNCQFEVEQAGSSDGGYLNRSPYPIDWCFIGPPISNSHSNNEIIAVSDIYHCLELYKMILNKL